MLFFVFKIVVEIIFFGVSVIFISILCAPKPKSPKLKAAGPSSSHGSVISDSNIKKSLKQQKKSVRESSTPPPPPALAESAPSAVAAFKRATKKYDETKPNSEKSIKDKSVKSTKEVVSDMSAKKDASPDMSEEHDLNPIVSSKEEKLE